MWRSASSAWCGLVHSPKRVVGPSDFCPIFLVSGMLDGIEGLRCLTRKPWASERAQRKAQKKESEHGKKKLKKHGFQNMISYWYHVCRLYSKCIPSTLDIPGVSYGYIASMLRLDLCGMPGAAHGLFPKSQDGDRWQKIQTFILDNRCIYIR